MDNGQWIMKIDNGQRTMDNGQWIMKIDNGQRTIDNGQRTKDNGKKE